jgi:hypothetical protein
MGSGIRLMRRGRLSGKGGLGEGEEEALHRVILLYPNRLLPAGTHPSISVQLYLRGCSLRQWMA